MTVRVLFICLGNICRSPMAEAVFRHMVEEAGMADRIVIDSAGTGSWHSGAPPHRGTQQVLRKHGISFLGQSARTLSVDDLDQSDYLVVMDSQNWEDVIKLGRHNGVGALDGKLVRLLDFADETVRQGLRDVPDPYYSGGFDRVYALVESGCRGLLSHISSEHDLEDPASADSGSKHQSRE